MKRYVKIYALLLTVLLAVSCGEEDPLNCSFYVTPLVKKTEMQMRPAVWENGEPKLDENGRPYDELTEVEVDAVTVDVEGFYFYTNEVFDEKNTDYSMVTSGRIALESGTTLSSSGKGQFEGRMAYHNLNQENVILILYETNLGMYAWRQVEFTVPIGSLETKLRFRGDRTENYSESGWKVVVPRVE